MDRTFLMVKPDGVQRGLIGRIISRLEDKGFKLVAGKLVQMSEEQAKRHYAEHEGKPFFDDLVRFITSGPVFAMVWEGDDIVTLARMVIGKTNVKEAAQVQSVETSPAIRRIISFTGQILRKVLLVKLPISLVPTSW